MAQQGNGAWVTTPWPNVMRSVEDRSKVLALRNGSDHLSYIPFSLDLSWREDFGEDFGEGWLTIIHACWWKRETIDTQYLARQIQSTHLH